MLLVIWEFDYFSTLWLFVLRKLFVKFFWTEIPLRSVTRNLSWLFCLAVSLLVIYDYEIFTSSLLVYIFPLSLRLKSFYYLLVEIELWARKDIDGCLDNVTPTKKSNFLSSKHVGLLCGYLYRELITTCLNWLDTLIESGKLKVPALIFLYVYLTSLD